MFVNGVPVFIGSFAKANKKLVTDPNRVWFDPLTQRPFKVNPAGIFCPLEPIGVPDIITFDGGGPQIFNDLDDIPDSPDLMEVKKFGSSVIEQTAGEKGKVTTTVGADTAYFRGKKDQAVKSTWEIEFEVDISAVGAQSDIFINDGDYSGNAAFEPASYVFGLVIFGATGDVRARHRNLSGTLTNVGGILTNYGIGSTGVVIVKLGFDGTSYTFSFDGATISVLKILTEAHTEEKIVIGECCDTTTVTLEVDNIKGAT